MVEVASSPRRVPARQIPTQYRNALRTGPVERIVRSIPYGPYCNRAAPLNWLTSFTSRELMNVCSSFFIRKDDCSKIYVDAAGFQGMKRCIGVCNTENHQGFVAALLAEGV